MSCGFCLRLWIVRIGISPGFTFSMAADLNGIRSDDAGKAGKGLIGSWRWPSPRPYPDPIRLFQAVPASSLLIPFRPSAVRHQILCVAGHFVAAEDSQIRPIPTSRSTFSPGAIENSRGPAANPSAFRVAA